LAQVESAELLEIEAQLVLIRYFQVLHLREAVVLEPIQAITLLLLAYQVVLVAAARQ
jgi:hypothetical protein